MTDNRQEQEQAALFRQIGLMFADFPELSVLFTIPSDANNNGVPGLCLPVARGPWHSLYIVLPGTKWKFTPDQERWQRVLRLHQNRVEVCQSWQVAIELLKNYLRCEPGGTKK